MHGSAEFECPRSPSTCTICPTDECDIERPTSSSGLVTDKGSQPEFHEGEVARLTHPGSYCEGLPRARCHIHTPPKWDVQEILSPGGPQRATGPFGVRATGPNSALLHIFVLRKRSSERKPSGRQRVTESLQVSTRSVEMSLGCLWKFSDLYTDGGALTHVSI